MFLYYFTDTSTQNTNYQQQNPQYVQQIYPWPVPSFEFPRGTWPQQPNVMCKLNSSLNVFSIVE